MVHAEFWTLPSNSVVMFHPTFNLTAKMNVNLLNVQKIEAASIIQMNQFWRQLMLTTQSQNIFIISEHVPLLIWRFVENPPTFHSVAMSVCYCWLVGQPWQHHTIFLIYIFNILNGCRCLAAVGLVSLNPCENGSLVSWCCEHWGLGSDSVDSRGLHAWDLIIRVNLCCVVTGVVSDAEGWGSWVVMDRQRCVCWKGVGGGGVMPELLMCYCLLWLHCTQIPL